MMNKNILILEDQPDGVTLLTRAVGLSYPQANIVVAADLAAVRQLDLRNIDIALIDLRLPDGLSIDWLAEFKHAQPTVIAIVTSLYDDDELVFAALRSGADGYLLKGEGELLLARALEKVLQGEPPISPQIARKLMAQFRIPSRASDLVEVDQFAYKFTEQTAAQVVIEVPAHRLTTREDEVLALIGSGLMIKQVAAKLGIGYHTVNDNIKSIYRKLGIRTRAQAASAASKRGLV